jgi:hypothetical protein
MKKIIAKEVNPAHVDFSFYFDDDGLKSVGGENCAVYIPGNRRSSGFNNDEWKDIIKQAQTVIDDYADGYPIEETLKEWAKHADTTDTDSIAEYLTITTGEEWAVKSFTGYCQGDYCEVVYCTAHYSEEHINEIGKLWLGCGTEFCIDDCYGYFVIDELRWEEGEKLRQYLADCYGCKPEELEIYLYDGEHIVTDYKIMD